MQQNSGRMRRRSVLWLLAGSLLAVPGLAFAQLAVIQGGIFGCDFATGQITAACIPNFIAHLIQFIFALSGTFFLINILVAGFQIATGTAMGAGREKGVERLRWSIIGFIVTACSFLILDLAVYVIIG